MTGKCTASMFLAAALIVPATTLAQLGYEGISANGTASMEKMPELMRLKIDIPASAPQMEEALNKIKEKRAAALSKLKELGAPEDAITFQGPTVATQQNEMMRQQMMMMRGQMDGMQDDEESPPKVDLVLTLKVEWPLKADQPEALLLAVHQLQQQIREADLAGLKEEEKTPEELEEEEEMQMQMPRFTGENETKPGEPSYLFVWKLSDADRARLLGEAFAKAQAEAKALAKAAGLELGQLVGLTSADAPAEEIGGYGYGYNQVFYQLMRGAGGLVSGDQAGREAVGPFPQSISKRIAVTVSYKPGGAG